MVEGDARTGDNWRLLQDTSESNDLGFCFRLGVVGVNGGGRIGVDKGGSTGEANGILGEASGVDDDECGSSNI